MIAKKPSELLIDIKTLLVTHGSAPGLICLEMGPSSTAQNSIYRVKLESLEQDLSYESFQVLRVTPKVWIFTQKNSSLSTNGAMRAVPAAAQGRGKVIIHAIKGIFIQKCILRLRCKSSLSRNHNFLK